MGLRTANILDMFHGDNREKPIDFAALMNAGIFAVIHKASQGSNYTDARYLQRAAAAKQAGMLWGAYHFLDASDPEKQAKHFLSVVNPTPDDNICLIADYEKTKGDTPSLHQLGTFMSYIDANVDGASCVCYSGDLIRETLTDHIGGHQADDMKGSMNYFGSHRLWLAEYGPHENIPKPWSKAWAWQFSETGREPGIVGNVDLNWYDGTREQLAAEWKSGGKGIAVRSGARSQMIGAADDKTAPDDKTG